MVHCIISLHLRVSFFFSFCVILLQKTILDEKQKSRQIAPKVLNYSWELHGIFHHGPSQFDSNSYPQNWLSALISLVSCVKKKKSAFRGSIGRMAQNTERQPKISRWFLTSYLLSKCLGTQYLLSRDSLLSVCGRHITFVVWHLLCFLWWQFLTFHLGIHPSPILNPWWSWFYLWIWEWNLRPTLSQSELPIRPATDWFLDGHVT